MIARFLISSNKNAYRKSQENFDLQYVSMCDNYNKAANIDYLRNTMVFLDQVRLFLIAMKDAS